MFHMWFNVGASNVIVPSLKYTDYYDTYYRLYDIESYCIRLGRQQPLYIPEVQFFLQEKMSLTRLTAADVLPIRTRLAQIHNQLWPKYA